VPFFWHPPWWTGGPVFGFGAAVFVGPALWYHYNWGHGGFAAIQTNTVLYSKFNKVNVSGGGQFQNWKFDPSHHGGVQFKNTKLQQQFGNLSGKNLQGSQTGKAIQGIQGVQTKSVQGVQTGKDVKDIQTAKRVEGAQTSKKQTGQNQNKSRTTRVVSSQRIQVNQPGKGAGKQVQGGAKINKKGPH